MSRWISHTSVMHKTSLTFICIVLLLTCFGDAKPNDQKNKTPKQVVPAIKCDVKAGMLTHQEFIAKCPADCRETKERVYGTGIFASVSSICNAAIHSGIINNSGGKVIVKKMAGQESFKGSYSNGVHSLSLHRWKESFIVSVGKPKSGVIYPSTLNYIPSNTVPVKSDEDEKEPKANSGWRTTAAPETTTTTTEPTTTMTVPSTATPSTAPTTSSPPTTKAKPRPGAHKVRDAGHTKNTHREGSSKAFRSSSTFPNRYPVRTNTGPRRTDQVSVHRRPSVAASGPALGLVQPSPPEKSQHVGLSNPNISQPAPDSGYTWSQPEARKTAVWNHRPDVPENWHLGHYPSRSGEPDSSRKLYPEETNTRVEPIDTWKSEENPFDAGLSIREQESLSRVPEPVSQGDPNCKVDLAFLMDGSWSIGRRRFKIQKDFLTEVSQVINVGVAGPMMGVIQYGDDPVTEFNLKSYSNSRDLKTAIEKISQKGGLSNVGKALAYINKHFFADANGNRGGAPNVAVVLVDGWPTDRVEEASRLARESGINIFFVTVEGPDDNEKQNVVEANFVDKAVCRTSGFFSLPVSSWFGLRKTVQPLVKRVCDTDRLVCSKTCLNANDIAFVIDGSSSVGTGNFRTVLQFVANITREFEISDTDTRVGAVQYTYEQRLEFAFGQYNSKVELLAAIKRINYWSGGTSTGAAITFAAEQLFSKSKPNKRKIMIVITDGRSYDDVRAPALAVRRSGVIAYSVGIAWAAQDELEDIATDPDKDHSFFVDEFDNLYKFVPKIIHNICQEFNSQPRN